MESIDYRVWDKVDNEIRGLDGFDSYTHEVKVCSVPSRKFRDGALHTVHALTRSYDDVEIMQYTGIRDKNGVKIYEKDIIRAQFDFGPAGYSERIAEINYDSLDGYNWSYIDIDTIEVVGNSKENPELLEG